MDEYEIAELLLASARAMRWAGPSGTALFSYFCREGRTVTLGDAGGDRFKVIVERVR